MQVNNQQDMDEINEALQRMVDRFPGIEEVGPDVEVGPLAFVVMAAKIAMLTGELEPFVQWIGGYAEARASFLGRMRAEEAH